MAGHTKLIERLEEAGRICKINGLFNSMMAIRDAAMALSLPVSNTGEWKPIETAPRDGTHCILAVKEDEFVYSVQGAFYGGHWNAVHRSNVEPLCWMPNVRVPKEFLPWEKSE